LILAESVTKTNTEKKIPFGDKKRSFALKECRFYAVSSEHESRAIWAERIESKAIVAKRNKIDTFKAKRTKQFGRRMLPNSKVPKPIVKDDSFVNTEGFSRDKLSKRSDSLGALLSDSLDRRLSK
jgi:hypothetical protein